jgi:dihydrofolate reductase
MRVYADISVSLDGFAAGPEPSLEDPLGKGGMGLHAWAVRLRAWRERHGMEGGEEGPESRWVEHSAGAYVMGRKMFSGGSGPWDDDPNATGWWEDEPPFHAPVFVLTSHAREPLELTGTTFHFVTEGAAAAVELAREAAGGKDVQVSGGPSVVQQCLALDLLDELQVHIAPLVLGGGTRLFDGGRPAQLETLDGLATPHATHVRYGVTRR